MTENYVRMSIDTNLTQNAIVKLAENIFSEFKWRQGDSDMMGRYLSGSNQKGAKIKIWFDEKPYDMAVSFSTEDESIKTDVLEKVNNVFFLKLKT